MNEASIEFEGFLLVIGQSPFHSDMKPLFKHAKASISAEADAALYVGETKMVLWGHWIPSSLCTDHIAAAICNFWMADPSQDGSCITADWDIAPVDDCITIRG